MNTKLNFMHLRNIDNQGGIDCRGGVTIAFTDNGDGNFNFATAACHPADNFSKAYGRTKAAGRLNSPRHTQTITCNSISDFRALMYTVLPLEQ
jgi:hypothetical protein